MFWQTFMHSINLAAGNSDDASFVHFAETLVRVVVVVHRPVSLFIFKIDHWFDHKWLRFSGKELGAFGVWCARVTIPPFVANRIVDQMYYERHAESDSYQLRETGHNIHYQGSSAKNFRRYVDGIAPNSALVWYSGNSSETGRGSLMCYLPVEGRIWPWYLSFVRDGDWRINRRKSIHEYEVRYFQSTGSEQAIPKADTGAKAT